MHRILFGVLLIGAAAAGWFAADLSPARQWQVAVGIALFLAAIALFILCAVAGSLIAVHNGRTSMRSVDQ